MIRLLFEDPELLVCVKPAGADSERDMPRLLSGQTGGGEIFCVHRLDKAVGGVMVYARTGKSAAALSAAAAERRLEKRYLAAAGGCPRPECGTMRDLLFKDSRRGMSFAVSRQRRGVKSAELEYSLIQERDGIFLFSVLLKTGRYHQIRAQFAARGLPLLGDGRYGSRDKGCGVALWSRQLSFVHPESGERLSFSAPPPDEYPWNKFDI